MSRHRGVTGLGPLVLLSIALAAHVHAAPPPLRIALSEDYAPWSSGSGGSVQGLARDLLTEILGNRMGYALDFEGYPWARAQRLVQEGDADLICTAISSSRLVYTLASARPVLTAGIRVYASNRPEVLRRLRGVKDLASLNAAPVRFNQYVGAGWMREHLDPSKTDSSGSLEQILAKLCLGRGDVVVENSLVARDKISRLQCAERIVELPPVLDSLSFHLLVGKRSRLAGRMPEIDATVDSFLASPRYKEILREYNLAK